MATFGQESPKPESMNLGDLVDFALLKFDPNAVADTIPKHVLSTIHYIIELYNKWGLADIEDIDWWLDCE